MTHERGALPPRTDLTGWRRRLVARAGLNGERLHERLKSRLLVGVAPPADDPFHRVPEDLEAFRPGEVFDARPSSRSTGAKRST